MLEVGGHFTLQNCYKADDFQKPFCEKVVNPFSDDKF